MLLVTLSTFSIYIEFLNICMGGYKMYSSPIGLTDHNKILKRLEFLTFAYCDSIGPFT
jgi:hypothetical protein